MAKGELMPLLEVGTEVSGSGKKKIETTHFRTPGICIYTRGKGVDFVFSVVIGSRLKNWRLR